MNRIRDNKLKMLISSIIILIPMIVGFVLWDKLPEQMATHWGFGGEVDGWSSISVAVIFLPMVLLAIHWLCMLLSGLDKSNRDQDPKAFGVVFWIIPIVSLYANGTMYATAFGMKIDIKLCLLTLLGIMFMVIGNYLPKTKRNYTLGVKLPWTVNNEENWNVTHRFCGKVWFVGGIVLMLTAFLPMAVFPIVLIAAIILLTGIPAIYSYVYYKKQLKDGRATKEETKIFLGKHGKIYAWSVVIGIVILLGAITFVCFTGDIQVSYGDEAFTVEASYWSDRTVNYVDIETIEYREGGVDGVRINGYGSPRLLMGYFNNGEFGNYIRYTYTDCDSCVVLKVKGNMLVLSGKTAESTKAIYDELLKRAAQ